MTFGSVIVDAFEIVGSSGDDIFLGREGAERFDGGAGNDYLSGGGGDDHLAGGWGNDHLKGGAGDDMLHGGRGTDRATFDSSVMETTIYRTDAGYTVSSIDGLDQLISVELVSFADVEDIRLDTLAIRADESLVLPGHDAGTRGPVLDVHVRDAVVDAAGAVDVAVSGAAEGVWVAAINRTSTLGGELRDLNPLQRPNYVIHTIGAEIEIDGEALKPTYYTLSMNERGAGGEAIAETALDAALLFGSVATRVQAFTMTEWRDVFFGRDEDDHILALGGRDRLYGQGGDDTLHGGHGADQIFGGRGDDRLYGEAGDDRLSGGVGADTFVFHAGSGSDTIVDYQTGDMIALRDFFPDGTNPHALAVSDGANVILSNGMDRIFIHDTAVDDLIFV